MAPVSKKHTWRFFRAGGVDQVVLERSADVEHLEQLDQKLWIALAMPTTGIALDASTARLLDGDGDGRIRAPDILDTVEWLAARMKSLDPMLEGEPKVPLSSISDEALRRTAERIAREKEPEASFLSLEHVEDAETRFANTPFNGDAIVPPEAVSDGPLRALLELVIATHGSVPDRCEKPGVNRALVEAFFEDARNLVKWHDAMPRELPLGGNTARGAELLRTLRPKLEDWFARSRLAAFDERASAVVRGTQEELAALATKPLSAKAPEIAALPLAPVVPDARLALTGSFNPAWAEDVVALRDEVIRPLLGAETKTFTDSDLRALVARFAPYEAWRGEKPTTKLDGPSIENVKSHLDGDGRDGLFALIARDESAAPEYEAIADVAKLVRLHRDFARVLHNFVNFADFYARKRALFQAGTLYLDGRACSLVLEVTDADKHASLAGLAASYLAYCDCTRSGQPKRSIVAAFTAGESDNLMVGRNGVFYDRAGNDWDATITKVVENPISIRQAFFSPYKKFIRLVEEQVARRATTADTEVQGKLSSAAEATANADRQRETAPAARARPRFDVGTVAALGVAVGGIGAMLTGVVSAFFGLGFFMPLGLLALMLMISTPSMLLAYLKLRRRNLGPLLDASGWAINGLAAINVPFGGALTDVAALPPGADRLMHDPYAEKTRPWRYYVVVGVFLALAIAWAVGALDRHLSRALRSDHVLAPLHAPTRAPATTPAPVR